MIIYPKAIAAPNVEPVPLAMLRAQVRADDTNEDALLFSYLIAAREMVEADIGQSLGSRTLVATSECWPEYGNSLLISVAVLSVTSITYTAVGGATVAWVDFVARKSPAGNTLIRPKSGTSWPTLGDDPVITVTAAGGLDPVPERAMQAVILLAAHWFDNRGVISTGTIAPEIALSYKYLVNSLGGARVA